MKALIVIFALLLLQTGELFAQKQSIDTSSYSRFSCLANPVLSGNGEYLAYNIRTGSIHGTLIKRVIQSTLDNWKIEVPIGDGDIRFTSDSKFCLLKTLKDTLFIIDLKHKSIKYIHKISDFNIAENGKWLLYQLIGEKNRVFVVNLKTGKEQLFSDVLEYSLDSNGRTVSFVKKLKSGDNEYYSVDVINLASGNQLVTELGKNIQNLVVDFKHNQFAFGKDSAIWYYKLGMSKPICLVNHLKQNLHDSLVLSSITYFGGDGNRLFVNLKCPAGNETKTVNGSVEIWSYTDAQVESHFISNESNVLYRAVINLRDKKITQLQTYANESLMKPDGGSDRLYLSKRSTGGGSIPEAHWNSKSQMLYAVVDGRTGTRNELTWLSDQNKLNPILSPSGKYIIFYDRTLKDYCSYELQSGKFCNLTKDIHTSWNFEGQTEYPEMIRGLACWISNDKAFLVYDSNDIWKLDPSGKNSAINLTNGFGVRNHIVFTRVFNSDKQSTLKDDEKLFLSAFDTESKENGFFSIFLQNAKDPEKLVMGSYSFSVDHMNILKYYDFEPIKAGNAELYIVQRMKADDAPNFFCTSDFKTFKRLTNIQPQKAYNWLTAELHRWRSLDGKALQGILYKPEDFDIKKKYPVIFYYYERLSDGLNSYLTPQYSEGAIDIPSYVSNGYLVFCPDIYHKPGDLMQGTFDSVVSAANYLSKFSFVNSEKMGIQGHSFGGVQTNYLVTQTNLFAAACTSSGLSDWISGYGSLNKNDGTSLQYLYETGQLRTGNTLWGNLTGFLKASPILYADKITTPLLIKHGKNDGVCPFVNELEFFLALRRLGKKVWMLAYPKGGHVLEGDDAKDHTVRMQQFFDYYLKDKSAPLWMLDNDKAKNQSIKNGLSLDESGRRPGPGLLTLKEQPIVDSLIDRESILELK
ncbi:alpha/beta hydrolase family protein [Pedobacter panaciterrae]